ncbi:O-antigen ligase family protein [Candidatus Kaiserbacteria bacterium]|nr:O-antigen ligase family protein [Candidatus Kaiserbacteria bacterium]
MMPALERAFSYALLAPAFLTLIFVDGLLYPYLTPKTILFRAAFLLALAAFAVLALSGKQFYFSRLRSPISWIPAALLVWAYVSSLFGVDFYHSFWSIFDRGDGLLTLTALAGFFYLTLVSADDAFVKRLFAVIVWTASLSALFGVLQWLQWASGIDIPLLPGEAERVSSTFGNPTFFSSYMALSLFVTLMLARDLSGRWQKWVYAGALLQFLGILAAATRGTLLAMVAAGFVALLYFAWRPALRSFSEAGGNEKYRTYARAGFAGVLIAAALFVTFRAQLASVPFAPVQRLAAISLSDTTVESRLFIWQNVVGRALQDPKELMVGVGSEHIAVVFNEFYDPTKIVEEWFDRTHNAFLDYLVQYGIPGLVLYLALIGAFMYSARRLLVSADTNERYRGLLFSLIAIVYAVQNFFVFDTALTLWFFLTLFAIMLTVRGVPEPLRLRALPQALPILVGVLVALLIYPVSIQPLRANIALAKGYLYQLVDARRSVGAIESGLKLDTYAEMEYGYQLYEWYSERQVSKLDGEERVLAYRAARDILEGNYAKYPYDARGITYYAHVLDLAPKGEEPDEEYIRGVLARAIELSPKRIQPRYLLANVSIKKGDALPAGSAGKRQYYEEAIGELAEYSTLVPNFAEPYYIIATLYQVRGDPSAAAEWAAKGLAAYGRQDTNTARRASRYYITVEDWKNAARFLTDVSVAEPENYPVLYDLAKAEFLAGNISSAREIVEKLRQKAPGLVETDPNFLRALEKAK